MTTETQSPMDWLDDDMLKTMNAFSEFTAKQVGRIPDDENRQLKTALQGVVLMVLMRRYASHLEEIVESAPTQIKASLREFEATLKKQILIVPTTLIDGAMLLKTIPGETPDQALSRLAQQLEAKPTQA